MATATEQHVIDPDILLRSAIPLCPLAGDRHAGVIGAMQVENDIPQDFATILKAAAPKTSGRNHER